MQTLEDASWRDLMVARRKSGSDCGDSWMTRSRFLVDVLVRVAAGMVFLGNDTGWIFGRGAGAAFLVSFLEFLETGFLDSGFLDDLLLPESDTPSFEIRPSSLFSRVFNRRSAIFSSIFPSKSVNVCTISPVLAAPVSADNEPLKIRSTWYIRSAGLILPLTSCTKGATLYILTAGMFISVSST